MPSALDSLREISDFLRREATIVVVHPGDVTDELRSALASAPLTTLRESRFVEPGKIILIHPGLLEDICG